MVNVPGFIIMLLILVLCGLTPVFMRFRRNELAHKRTEAAADREIKREELRLRAERLNLQRSIARLQDENSKLSRAQYPAYLETQRAAGAPALTLAEFMGVATSSERSGATAETSNGIAPTE